MKEEFSFPNKNLRLYLVEEGDDLRERVIVANVGGYEFEIDTDWNDVVRGDYDRPIGRFSVQQEVILKLKLVEAPSGAFFRIENFNETTE